MSNSQWPPITIVTKYSQIISTVLMENVYTNGGGSKKKLASIHTNTTTTTMKKKLIPPYLLLYVYGIRSAREIQWKRIQRKKQRTNRITLDKHRAHDQRNVVACCRPIANYQIKSNFGIQLKYRNFFFTLYPNPVSLMYGLHRNAIECSCN